MTARDLIKEKKRWVVKVGSALLTNDGQGLHVELIGQLAQQINFLRQRGIEVLLVSSGAVAAGMAQLGMPKRPEQVDALQAAAAVGQVTLIRQYEQAFKEYGIKTAQVLLTHSDIANRARYLNAKSTLTKLLELGVLTVVNENDTVATEEICFGDNDNLAALVANITDADLMVILTDQDGLYTSDPRLNSTAQLLSEVQADDETLLPMASGASILGRGGMVTKLTAAQSAARSGASTVIANGRIEQVLERLFEGEILGTLLLAKQRIKAKKQWMAGHMRIQGAVVLDDGAAKVIKQDGGSLLVVGVVDVRGGFERGELLSCIDGSGKEIARGLSNYNAEETGKLLGKSSGQIAEILGYKVADELIHRDNLVVL
ncbi:MAG: glutamate 5-kinase [Arenicella sp.]|jgi:glutamate 5-kinase